MGTNYQGTEDEKLSLNSYITLLRSSETISSKLNSLLSQNRLTISQFGVLEALYYLGPLCQTELGAKILKSTANITTVIDNLEKREYVQRVRSKEDRRYLTIHLIKKGKEQIEKILPLHIQEVLQCMSVLSTRERMQLYKITKKLGLANAEASS